MHGVDTIALPDYDHSYLNAPISPRDLCIILPANHLGEAVEAHELESAFAFEKKSFSNTGGTIEIIAKEQTPALFTKAIEFLNLAG